jgi:hypothetical protein
MTPEHGLKTSFVFTPSPLPAKNTLPFSDMSKYSDDMSKYLDG